MTNRITRLAALLVFVVAVFSATPPAAPASATAPSPDRTAADDTASFLHSSHIRKLHLVRPDLIPFPVHYAIYC